MNATGTSRLGWYVRRAARMSPAEMGWRVWDQLLRAAWAGRQVTGEQLATVAVVHCMTPVPQLFTALSTARSGTGAESTLSSRTDESESD